MKCLMCLSEQKKVKFIYSGKDIYLEKLNVKYELEWFECSNCGVFFSKQYNDIDKVYEDKSLYDASYDKNEILIRYNKILSIPAEKSDNLRRVERFLEYFEQYKKLHNIKKSNYSLLDIGSGLGVFLSKLKIDERFVLKALELNPVAVEHLIGNVGVNTCKGHMQDLNFEKEFDLITLNRVLEHIQDPIHMMKLIVESIKYSGLIYIELPDSISYKLDGSGNEAFSSGHYMVYNPKSIEYLFNKAGVLLYSMGRVKEPSGKYTIYAFGGIR